jgi:excisionase family DNA binding protein
LLNTEEAAAYLGTSPRHVRKLWSERKLAAVLVGRLVRFDRGDLDAYVTSRRIEAVR